MNQKFSLVGCRFGKLTVICYAHGGDGALWYCRCDCGGESIAKAASLRYGSTKSCGCGSKAQASANIHAIGKAARGPYYPHTRRLKELHRNMLDRCYNPKNRRYDSYGGRGIRVCEEWRTSRVAFYEWVMLNGWGDGATLDRIEVNGNYEPSNCRSVGTIVQANNTTRNRYLELDGKRQSIAEWSRERGISSSAILHRLDRGWAVGRALTQPLR